MKTLATLFVLFATTAQCVLAAEPPATTGALPVLDKFTAGDSWQTDYPHAIAQAAESKKTVLLNFTGSDWCVWCHRLRDEVFTQKPFLDFAGENLVLVELDFPRKTSQAATQKAQNEKLAAQFHVTSYPTIVVVDSSGRELGRTGYMYGGAKTFVRELKRFKARATSSNQ
jgi:protein disulfide-isomerase